MTTYNQIAGRRVNFLSSDPTYVDTNSDGQVWYNSSTATLKSWLPTGAWISGGSLPTATTNGGGAGIQTAALYFGGATSPLPNGTSATYSYNGIAWTPVSSMVTGRTQLGGLGTQTAALAFGGYPKVSTTELWNGISWTSNPTGLNTAREYLGRAGIQTAGLAFGGYLRTPDTTSTATESFNGSTWTSVNSMNTARSRMGSAGVQTAALAFGGSNTVNTSATESWNGTSWTTSPASMNTVRSGLGGAGVQTSAIGFGGSTPAPANTGATELWNGTSWTTSPATLATARQSIIGTGTQTAALAMGGTPYSTAVEEWNFGVYSYSAAAWASGGNLNTARDALAGCGTQTASLAFGGFAAGNNSTSTEKYNGTSWTATGSLNTARRNISGFGIQTAAIAAGGASPGGNSNAAESFNGSTWTSVTSMNTARGRLAAANGSPQTAGLIFAGNTGPALSAATESWNGSSWTSVNSMNTGRNWPGGLGTQTAALAFGGNNYIGGGLTPTVYSATESWNGTSWTTVNSLNVPRYYPGGTGIQTAGLAFGGNGNGPSSGPFPLQTVTESYNGTSWTNLPNMTTARGGMASAGTQTAALGAGGYTTTAVATTEEWTGEVATATSKTLTTS